MNRLIFNSALDSDLRYAIRINITSSIFYLEIGKKKYAFLDQRDFGLIPNNTGIQSIPIEPFKHETERIHQKTGSRNKLGLAILKKYRLIGKNIQVPSNFPLDMADFLRKNGAKLTPDYPLFPERAVKNKSEIKIISENLRHTKQSFRTIEKILRESVIRKNLVYYKNRILTSEILKQEAEKSLIDRGMYDLLGMIISCGKDTSIPHHEGSGPIYANQTIICDIYPRHRVTGYYADMTRTYVKGNPSEDVKKMYKAVLSAQNVAMKTLRAGISATEVYEIAASSLLRSGYHVGEFGFTHGLGHGVGLDIHEAPSLKPESDDILEAGNLITIEPGLYYPGIGGVRLEDILVVTETGSINLTNYPKVLAIP